MYQGINISRDKSKRSVDAFPLMEHGHSNIYVNEGMVTVLSYSTEIIKKKLTMTLIAKCLPTSDILFIVPLAIARG